MATAMLADFATRLACGLAVMLLATPWRVVPPAFFRTHCQIILGLAGPGRPRPRPGGGHAPRDGGRGGGGGPRLLRLGGLGPGPCPGSGCRSRRPSRSATGRVLAGASWGDPRGRSVALNASGSLASAALMGSTLTAMLLGHHYLTAPAMSIAPLRAARAMDVLGIGRASGSWPARGPGSCSAAPGRPRSRRRSRRSSSRCAGGWGSAGRPWRPT